jgi:catechol 2,3-dioxygenase-like lactoylglutathione lyase family enzyme
MKRVTGLGGIFFKTSDPKQTNEWYQRHLGIAMNPWGGSSFHWKDAESGEKGRTEWCTFKADTQYFEPSQQPFMINYRVENLVALLELLKAEGVTIVGGPDDTEYGKFAWIMDPDGNKIELWEPPAEK